MTTPVNISIFNSTSDIEFADMVCKHLFLLQENGKINSLWHSGMINPGEEIASVLANKVQSSNLIILMISIDFFLDKDLLEVMKRVETAYYKGTELEVYSILCRFCDWQSHKFLSTLRILPHTDKPIVSRDWYSQDEVYLIIKESLELNINRIRKTGIKPLDRIKTLRGFFLLSTGNKLLLLGRKATTVTFKIIMGVWTFLLLSAVINVLPIHWAFFSAIVLALIIYQVIRMKDVFIEKWKAVTSSSLFSTISSYVKDYLWEKFKEFIMRK